MKQFSKLLLLGMIVAALVAIVVPVGAQDVPAGEGGTIIESNIGDDPATFNPIIGNDTVSDAVSSWMYPNIIALDDVTLVEAPGAPGGLAESWEYDETGTVLTLHIRQDMFWSDGEQITADDYIWAYNAIKSGQTTSPRTAQLYQLDDGTVTDGTIHSITKIDDFTIEVVLGTVDRDEEGNPITDDDGNLVLLPNCAALSDLNSIAVVPEHIYAAAFGMDYAGMDADPYFVPEGENGLATFGVFTDPFIEFGVQVSLLANQDYIDAISGQVTPGEWLMQNVEDQTVEYERFLAGDFTTIGVSADNQNALRADGSFQTIEYPSNGYTYMGFNLADPSNPQPGRDEDGNLVDQGIHPIFGDLLVRQAIAHAIDVRSIIGSRPDGDNPATGILEGNGYLIATHNHPGLSSTDDELADAGVEPYAFDLELAASLLEEAGWVDIDDDGIRECQGCLYATEVDASFEGSEFEFELLTNAGNNIREATGETIRAQLAEIGIVVDFQAIEFGTLVDELVGQEFDAIIIGWRLGLPFNAGAKGLFGVGADIPGSGFNFTSYQNADYERLVDEGDALAGCDPDARDALYVQTQIALWEDLPYVWLFATNTMIAAQPDLAG
ncbi:MAG: ABC transporter substrate-binding protein [Anaerolineae bacterium]|nr:ABC transporter substrate-binding protein [Anaerolineae bacterium]